MGLESTSYTVEGSRISAYTYNTPHYATTHRTVHEIGLERLRKSLQTDVPLDRPLLHPPPHLLLVARCRLRLPVLVVRRRVDVLPFEVHKDVLVLVLPGVVPYANGEGLPQGDESGVVGVEVDRREDGLALQVLVRFHARKAGGGRLDRDEEGYFDTGREDPMLVRDEELRKGRREATLIRMPAPGTLEDQEDD